MRRLPVPIFLAALLLAGCVASPEAARQAPGAPAYAPVADEGPLNKFLLDAPRPFNAAVSQGEEPIVLVDSAGGRIWVADTAGVHRSTDGGATWRTSPDPFLPGLFTDGWTLAQDDAGTLYAATTQGQVIGVAASTDGGATWSSTALVAEVASIADRPWLAAKGNGEVALLFYGDNGEGCAYSSDGGKTFLTKAVLNTGTPNAGNAVFDSAGRLWYAEDLAIHYWPQPCQGNLVTKRLPPSGPQIFTQVAVDANGGSYVAQPTTNNSKMQVRAFQTPTSPTWKTVNVSVPQLRSNTFGAIAVHGDEVAVAWYGSESAGNPSGSFSGEWNVYVARIRGYWTAAPTITHDRLTTEPNHVGGFCMSGIACTPTTDRDLLDYFGVAYDPGGNLHVAYGHDGAGTRAEVRYAFLPALGG